LVIPFVLGGGLLKGIIFLIMNIEPYSAGKEVFKAPKDWVMLNE